MAYWLFKSEPDEFSIDCLANAPDKTSIWDGIRNYQARNLLRDEVAVGDLVFFYHSSCPVPGIAGIAEVTAAPYPDPSQFNPDSPYFDGLCSKTTASSDQPRWYSVDIRFKQKFSEVLSRKTLKSVPELSEMTLFKQSRLSIQPVTDVEWHTIISLAKTQ